MYQPIIPIFGEVAKYFAQYHCEVENCPHSPMKPRDAFEVKYADEDKDPYYGVYCAIHAQVRFNELKDDPNITDLEIVNVAS